jgi:hypothetical protein
VSELATAQIGDLDEHRCAMCARCEVEKNERYRLPELPRRSVRVASRRCLRVKISISTPHSSPI